MTDKYTNTQMTEMAINMLRFSFYRTEAIIDFLPASIDEIKKLNIDNNP